MTPDPASSPLLNRRRRTIQARHLFAAASVLAVVLAAGCSSGGGGGTGQVSGTVTIAAVAGVDDAPLWLAQEKGIFAADGLNVVIKTFGNGSDAAQVAAVEDGQAKIAASDYGNILAEQASNSAKSTLRLLADGYDAGAGTAEILVGPGSKIGNPAQLLNQTIGVPDDFTISTNGSSISSVQKGLPESLDAVAATQAIENYLLSDALSLKWKPMPQQQELSELQSGQLQAALVTEPYLYKAEADFGAVELMDVFSGQSANLPLTGYVSQTSWAKTNPQAVADFQAAISKAQADASTVGPVQQTLHKAAGMTVSVADMVNVGTYPTVTSKSGLERVATLMDTAGVVKVDSEGFLQSLLGS